MRYKYKKSYFQNDLQLSFLAILDATLNDVVRQEDENHTIRFSDRVGLEIIRDAVRILLSPASSKSDKLDEIAWFFSEKTELPCSFYSCCRAAGLDPEETTAGIMENWQRQLRELEFSKTQSKKTKAELSKMYFEYFKKAYHYMLHPKNPESLVDFRQENYC